MYHERCSGSVAIVDRVRLVQLDSMVMVSMWPPLQYLSSVEARFYLVHLGTIGKQQAGPRIKQPVVEAAKSTKANKSLAAYDS